MQEIVELTPKVWPLILALVGLGYVLERIHQLTQRSGVHDLHHADHYSDAKALGERIATIEGACKERKVWTGN